MHSGVNSEEFYKQWIRYDLSLTTQKIIITDFIFCSNCTIRSPSGNLTLKIGSPWYFHHNYCRLDVFWHVYKVFSCKKMFLVEHCTYTWTVYDVYISKNYNSSGHTHDWIKFHIEQESLSWSETWFWTMYVPQLFLLNLRTHCILFISNMILTLDLQFVSVVYHSEVHKI
jgi:hypothetical protein